MQEGKVIKSLGKGAQGHSGRRIDLLVEDAKIVSKRAKKGLQHSFACGTSPKHA